MKTVQENVEVLALTEKLESFVNLYEPATITYDIDKELVSIVTGRGEFLVNLAANSTEASFRALIRAVNNIYVEKTAKPIKNGVRYDS